MQNPHHFLHVGRHIPCDTWLPCRYTRQNSPGTPSPPLTREKVRPARPLQRCFHEKTRPARHKTPIMGHFSCAGRTFSRTGICDVATLKPTTPLQPLMQTNVKPRSPLLAPVQQPLKPPSPLQPKNTPKTPISHPQRRCRFHPRLTLRPQRRRRFHARDFQCPRAMVGPGCGGRGRWRGLAGLRDDAPSEARSADGERAGRRPPAHTAAGPSGARNTRGAVSKPARRVRPRGGRRSGEATSNASTLARHSKRGRHQPTPCASALTHP